MEFSVILASIFSPEILFFVFGMIAVLVKSDLVIPPELSKACAIFLLLSIGLEGGIEGVEAVAAKPEILLVVVAVAAFGVVLSSFTSIGSAKVLKSIVGLKTADAWATAGLYGAVSSATFLLAASMANDAQEALPGELIYGGWMPVANIFLDAPGVIVAILFGRLALLREAHGAVDNGNVNKGELLRDAIFGFAVWLMISGMLVGVLGQSFSPRRMEGVMEFFDGMFNGVLSIFLLEMGMMAANRLGELKAYGTRLVRAALVAWILPNVWAFAAAIGMYGINLVFPGLLGWGDAFVFTAMAGGASFISGPPAMRIAFPEANPSIYLPMSLVLSFPFNILVGMPLWMILCRALWGVL